MAPTLSSEGVMSHSLFAASLTYDQPLVNAATRAIELALHSQRSDDDDRLREAMRQLCVDARRLSMRPEELIILFKLRWAHTELGALPREDASSALDHLITMCIEEYYASGLPS
jgi:hypothetical protein